MDETTTTTEEIIQQDESAFIENTSTIEAIMNATQDMTTQQAAVAISGITVLGLLGCFVCDLIKGNQLKEIDVRNKRVTFYENRNAEEALSPRNL